jgi:hypothetical protein
VLKRLYLTFFSIFDVAIAGKYNMHAVQKAGNKLTNNFFSKFKHVFHGLNPPE